MYLGIVRPFHLNIFLLKVKWNTGCLSIRKLKWSENEVKRAFLLVFNKISIKNLVKSEPWVSMYLISELNIHLTKVPLNIHWIFTEYSRIFTNIHEYSPTRIVRSRRRVAKNASVLAIFVNIHWIFKKWPILAIEYSTNIHEYSGSWIFSLWIFSSLRIGTIVIPLLKSSRVK